MSALILKLIASLSMLIDHAGLMLFNDNPTMRMIGRLAFPIFAFFIAEGFRYTKSKARYAARLLIFALISQPFYAFAHGETLMTSDLNMIFTLLLSFFTRLTVAKVQFSHGITK